MNSITRAIILFLFCLLVSANVYAYDVTETAYPMQDENPADAEKTLSFNEARELAIAYSIDLRHSYSSQLLFEKAWKLGRRAYFPQIQITASENDRWQQLGQDSYIKNYGIGAEQLLFDGGRTRLSRKLEKMELELSSYQLERMASEIGEAAITAYRNILLSRSILEIKKAALYVLEEHRRILSEEVNLGLALQIDLMNADINLADAKIGINSLELDLAEMEKQFAEILGLDELPVLAEEVDINYSILLPDIKIAATLAQEKNPNLVEARLSIARRQTELKYVSGLWIPTFKATGNFSVSGQQYPLTRYNWSVGINIDFTNAWFQNRLGFQLGWEPPYDKTAVLQNSFSPFSNLPAAVDRRKARLALALEREKYQASYEQIARIAANAVEKCAFAEQRRVLALQAAVLGEERCRIEEIRLNLGQITRITLIEVLIEQTQREIAAVEAATALQEAERELEKFLDLKPGELKIFTQKWRY